MEPTRLSPTELTVLAILAEGPTHGFAIAKLLREDGEVGRVFTVRRPLVYRALDRLVEAGLAEPSTTERGDAGPNRVVHRATSSGRRRATDWLAEPVAHVRDLRIEFLLKITLIHRVGRSPSNLIRAQRDALADTITALAESPPVDHIELWRRHAATAAASYLTDLAAIHDRE